MFAGRNGCGDIQLTTAWSASAAFEHLWTPALRTSWYGSYVEVSHNAAGNFLICNNGAAGSMFTAGDPALTGCNSDWSQWNLGTRTQWEPVKGFVVGLDVIYNKLNTAQSNFQNIIGMTAAAGGMGATSTPGTCLTTGVSSPIPCYRNDDMDAWNATFRVHRDFLP